MRRAIFPGTFDPFTIGHSSVVSRALTFIDEIVIGIGINENKNTYFPLEKREQMIRDYYRNEPRIIVQSYDCLTIDFARQVDAGLIIRGIRTVKDPALHRAGTYLRQLHHRARTAAIRKGHQHVHTGGNGNQGLGIKNQNGNDEETIYNYNMYMRSDGASAKAEQ